MKVFVAAYKGPEGIGMILGVFTDIEKARKTIYQDYKEMVIGGEPITKIFNNNRIYIRETDYLFHEWYIEETELYNEGE